MGNTKDPIHLCIYLDKKHCLLIICFLAGDHIKSTANANSVSTTDFGGKNVLGHSYYSASKLAEL